MRRWLPAYRGEHPFNAWLTSLEKLHEDIDRWFEDFTKGWPLPEPFERFRTMGIHVDLYENEKEIILDAELPGVEAQDLDVRVLPREVRIKAEKKKAEEFKDNNVHRQERFYGSVARTVYLPTEIDPDQAKATFKNGILKLTLPKVGDSGAGRKLTIE